MKKNNNKPVVYIVDDDSAIGESLKWLIEPVNLESKIYRSAQEFLDDYKPTHHGCLLLDIRMPELSGLELQKQLLIRKVTLPIIFITGHGDLTIAVKAMKAGAVDFLTKPFNDQELLDSIHQAIKKDEIQHQKRKDLEKINACFSSLSSREKQIMNSIVKGNPNKIVAKKLGIPAKTVELHRASIMKKTQVKSFAELVRRVLICDMFPDEFASDSLV